MNDSLRASLFLERNWGCGSSVAIPHFRFFFFLICVNNNNIIFSCSPWFIRIASSDIICSQSGPDMPRACGYNGWMYTVHQLECSPLVASSAVPLVFRAM